jgi:hypothetical protein
MKYYLLGLLCLPCLVFSQILTLSGGSSITIENTASINLDGLTFAPNSTYDILDNIISLSASPVEVNTNSSIDRVYNTSQPIQEYQATTKAQTTEADLRPSLRVTATAMVISIMRVSVQSFGVSLGVLQVTHGPATYATISVT